MKDDLTLDEWFKLVRKELDKSEWYITVDNYELQDSYEQGYTPEEVAESLQPDIEPEACDSCEQEMEDDGIEYTMDVTWDGSTFICDHCGRPI